MATTNQAWQLSSPGTLTLVTLPSLPSPGPKQALIRMRAVAVNPRDNMILNHSPHYPVKHKPNLVPCADGAGIVEQSGEGSSWKVGDTVIPHSSTWLRGLDPRDWKLETVSGAGEVDGTLRRFAVYDDDLLVRAPTHLSVEESATLIVAGLTAYRALFYGPLPLKPGMTVLVQGTGGVSCFAIQIAVAAGATVIATSSSDEKLEVAKKLGATHLINYCSTPDWVAEVQKLTGSVGADLTIDVMGAETLEKSIRAVRFGGAVVSVAMGSKEPHSQLGIASAIFLGAKTVQGQLGAGSKELANEFVLFLEKHQIHPQIAQTFDFEQAKEAFEAMRQLSAPGKLLVKM